MIGSVKRAIAAAALISAAAAAPAAAQGKSGLALGQTKDKTSHGGAAAAAAGSASPATSVSSTSAPASDQRLGWALPVNVEARTRRARIYGSTGYFSRGSVFVTVAADVPAGRKASFTANFGRSFASGSHETDLGAGLALFTSPTTSVFISLGRAFMSDPAAAGGMSLGGGVSV